MGNVDYEQISKEQGWTTEELKRGYTVFYDSQHGVELIQKLDCLDEYGIAKFKSDTEAGEQALKDGYKLFTVNQGDLMGWYILDKPEYRKALNIN